MEIDKVCYCFIWLVLTCGTIAIVTSAATPHWLKAADASLDIHQGIFQMCDPDCDVIKFWQAKISSYIPSEDFDVKQNESEHVPEAARLCIIACLGLLLLATLLNCLSPWIEKDVSFAYILIDIGAFLTCLAGMVLYTIEYKDSSVYNWSWGYILAWAGCGLHAIGIALMCWAGCVDSSENLG